MSEHSGSLMRIAERIFLLGQGGISIVPDGDSLLERPAEIHRIETAKTYWWESLKGANYFPYDDSSRCWQEQILAILDEMGIRCFLQ